MTDILHRIGKPCGHVLLSVREYVESPKRVKW